MAIQELPKRLNYREIVDEVKSWPATQQVRLIQKELIKELKLHGE